MKYFGFSRIYRVSPAAVWRGRLATTEISEEPYFDKDKLLGDYYE